MKMKYLKPAIGILVLIILAVLILFFLPRPTPTQPPEQPPTFVEPPGPPLGVPQQELLEKSKKEPTVTFLSQVPQKISSGSQIRLSWFVSVPNPADKLVAENSELRWGKNSFKDIKENSLIKEEMYPEKAQATPEEGAKYLPHGFLVAADPPSEKGIIYIRASVVIKGIRYWSVEYPIIIE